jgi:hypothetical protein
LVDFIKPSVHSGSDEVFWYYGGFCPYLQTIKQRLRTLRAQTVETLIDAIADALSTITPYDAIGFFAHAGLLNLD